MNIKKYFETSEAEPRLIDLIAFFYLINVIGYTSDDLKGNYPIALVTMGLVFHLATLLTWIDDCKTKSKLGTYKRLVYKALPIGLAITYLTSILYLVQNRKLTYATHYNIFIFMLTAVPMIMFFSSIGYRVKSFDFLKQQRKGINNLFLVIIVVMLIGQKIINN